MTSTQDFRDGRMTSQTVDHGDGKGTRTTYGPTGEVTSTEELTGLAVIEPIPPTAADLLGAMPAAQATAMATLALGIAGDAGTLWQMLEAMAHANTARPLLDLITHHALTAGLALLEETP